MVLPADEATGPCKARALAQQLWEGEEFHLQASWRHHAPQQERALHSNLTLSGSLLSIVVCSAAACHGWKGNVEIGCQV